MDKVKECNGKPFLIETNTLYEGRRTNAVDHISHAHEHGFGYENVGAPIIIGDGFLANMMRRWKSTRNCVNMLMCQEWPRAANAIISIAHVTGHLMAGMGATLKNIGMGLSSRGGKLAQHSGVTPQILKKRCSACGVCGRWCPVDAIKIEEHYAVINSKICIGCGECLAFASLVQ